MANEQTCYTSSCSFYSDITYPIEGNTSAAVYSYFGCPYDAEDLPMMV